MWIMLARRGFVLVAALCALAACKDKQGDPAKDPAAKSPSTGVDLDQRCDQLANACGDQAKHVDKIAAECKQLATKLAAKNCTGAAAALLDCYGALCGGSDRVWSLDDLRVLATRHVKCVDERAAALACEDK
jgi:hypothetical protein